MTAEQLTQLADRAAVLAERQRLLSNHEEAAGWQATADQLEREADAADLHLADTVLTL